MEDIAENTAKPSKKKNYGTTDRIELDSSGIKFADFLAQNHVWIQLFREHLADFSAFDADFSIAFADTWQTDTDALVAMDSDETQRDEIAYRTAEVLKSHQALMKLVDDLDYYTGKAFPTDPRKIDELGLKLMRRDANTTQAKFVIWGYTALRVAQDYQPALTAAGLPAAWWTDFETALNACGEAEINQEYAKRQRIRKTTERVTQFNALHKTWQKVNRAAKVIYRDRPEMVRLWYWK